MAHRHLQLLLLLATLFSPVSSVAAAADEPAHAAESWYAIEFEGQRVGYEWVRTASHSPGRPDITQTDNSKLIRRERRTQLQLKRAGTRVSLAAVLVTTETPEGLLQAWELTRTAADGSRIHRRGIWDGSRSAMRIDEPDHQDAAPVFAESQMQPHSPIFTEWLGQAAANEGFPKTVPVLFPESAIAADVELQNLGNTTLELSAGSRTAARRFLWQPVSAPQLRTRVFLEANTNRCLLVEQPLLGGTLKLVRSTPEVALGIHSQQTLDLQLQTLLPVTGQVPESPPENGLRLKLTSNSPSPYSLANTSFQTVESRITDGLIVVCRTPKWPEPGQSLSGGRSRHRGDHAEYLGATRWIDSADPAVQRLLNSAGGRSGTTAEQCRQLSAFVNRRVQFSAFTTQLQPASRVAARLQGDCTEHTVLLCALLRSRGIPARAASGFAYVPQLTAFAPHLWTEALVDGIWMPLDSTIPDEAAMPLLLKVADSPLGNDLSGSVSLFAPLLPLCGQVSITVISED
ncbi:MAG: transglutaminase-like domain-containing protein [Planctomycetaceae bacterium]